MGRLGKGAQAGRGESGQDQVPETAAAAPAVRGHGGRPQHRNVPRLPSATTHGG